MPPEPPLIDLYRLHSEEVRFQVQLNWDRAKSSLTFHVTLLALIAAFGKTFDKDLTVALLAFVAFSAVLSGRILWVSHGYYQAARDRRMEIESKLETSYAFVTTPGQRKEKRSWWPNVTQILIAQHVLLAVLSAGGAVVYALR